MPFVKQNPPKNPKIVKIYRTWGKIFGIWVKIDDFALQWVEFGRYCGKIHA